MCPDGTRFISVALISLPMMRSDGTLIVWELYATPANMSQRDISRVPIVMTVENVPAEHLVKSSACIVF